MSSGITCPASPASVEDLAQRCFIHSVVCADDDEPRELCARLAWDRRSPETPQYEACPAALAALFASPGAVAGLVLRRRRFLVEAVVD
jgi:hypothetical protein